MIRGVIALVLVGCWTDPARPTAAPTAKLTADAAVVGCNDAHDCVLRDVCGCSCEGVLVTASKQVACDESCPTRNACDGYTLFCDLATHRCGAIPKWPDTP